MRKKNKRPRWLRIVLIYAEHFLRLIYPVGVKRDVDLDEWMNRESKKADGWSDGNFF